MSTLVEIQNAVLQLPSTEKLALQLWLNSQVEPIMTTQEEERLLHSLDEAARHLDAGKGVAMDDARRLISAWAAK